MDVIISNKSGRKFITIISPVSNQTMTTNSNGPDRETTALSTMSDQDETTAAAAPRVTITAPHDIITTVVNNILSNHHSSPIANSVVAADNSIGAVDNSNDTTDNSVPSGNVPKTAAEGSKVKKAGASNVDFSVALSELMDKVRENCFFFINIFIFR
jgi:hypothetical protein